MFNPPLNSNFGHHEAIEGLRYMFPDSTSLCANLPWLLPQEMGAENEQRQFGSLLASRP